jgi:hypothetical protein
MNQLTTIAALPNGAGQAAALPAETVTLKLSIDTEDIGVYFRSLLAQVETGEISPGDAYRMAEEWSINRALKIALQPIVSELAAQIKASPVGKYAGKCPVKFA